MAKSKETVSIPAPSAYEIEQIQRDAALRDALLADSGYEEYREEVFNEGGARQYINENPGLGYNPDDPTHLQGAWEHYISAGKGEGKKWSVTMPKLRKKPAAALTPEEQQRADREKEIEDLQYRKLKGELTPEENALLETEYGSAMQTGESDINAQFRRLLDEINIGGGRAADELNIGEGRIYDDITSESRTAAAERGLGYGDTPIAGERQKQLMQAGEDIARQKRLLGEDVGRQKGLLAQDTIRNVADLKTNLLGAKAGAKLNVMGAGQMFAQGLREFQAQLAQQGTMNKQVIAQMYANNTQGLAAERARNYTRTTTVSDPNQGMRTAAGIFGGIGGLAGGIGSIWK